MKDLGSVIIGSEAKKEETGLETVDLGKGIKSALRNLKDTDIF